MHARGWIALIAALSICMESGAQSMFKCVGRDGKVVYQDSRCADDARQSTVAPPSSVAGPAAAPPAPAASADKPSDPAKAPPPPASQQPEVPMDVVVGMLSNYQSCAEDVPGFASKFDAGLQQWKRRNRVAMTRYDQDGPAQRQVRESLEFERRQTRSDNAEGRAAKAEMCEQNIGSQLGTTK